MDATNTNITSISSEAQAGALEAQALLLDIEKLVKNEIHSKRDCSPARIAALIECSRGRLTQRQYGFVLAISEYLGSVIEGAAIEISSLTTPRSLGVSS
jgi:hypothetical protein